MRPFELLVFDWDGTLIDSISAIVSCTQRTLTELGLDEVDEGLIRGGIGLGLRETVERFCPGCDDELFRRILATYRSHWLARYGNLSLPFAGVPEMLERLRARGYLTAVATAKGRTGLGRDLERTGLAPLFDASRTMDEAPSKPSPVMLLSLLEELGVEAERALMIGDTCHDMAMASNAGIAGVAVTSGSQGEDQLRAEHPLAVLPGVANLPAWLQRQAAPALRTGSR